MNAFAGQTSRPHYWDQRRRYVMDVLREMSDVALAIARAAAAQALRDALEEEQRIEQRIEAQRMQPDDAPPPPPRRPPPRGEPAVAVFLRMSAEVRRIIAAETRLAAGALAPAERRAAGRRQATPADKRRARIRAMLVDAVDRDLRGRGFDALMRKVDERLALPWLRDAVERGEPVGDLAAHVAELVDVAFDLGQLPDCDIYIGGLPPEDPDNPDPPRRDYGREPPWNPGWGENPGPDELVRRTGGGGGGGERDAGPSAEPE